MPLKGTVAGAQVLAQRQTDAIRGTADARFGHAAQVLLGVCTAYDSDLRQLTIRELGNQLTFTATDAGLTVTAAQLIGRLVLCEEDAASHLVWLRFRIEGAA